MVDINALQADGATTSVLRTEPVADKWAAFGWHVERVDGNDVPALLHAFDNAAAHAAGRPAVVLCDTKVGKGVPLLENPGEGALHAHRGTRMADLPRPTHRRPHHQGRLT